MASATDRRSCSGSAAPDVGPAPTPTTVTADPPASSTVRWIAAWETAQSATTSSTLLAAAVTCCGAALTGAGLVGLVPGQFRRPQGGR
jgi:hypothetical protein